MNKHTSVQHSVGGRSEYKTNTNCIWSKCDASTLFSHVLLSKSTLANLKQTLWPCSAYRSSLCLFPPPSAASRCTQNGQTLHTANPFRVESKKTYLTIPFIITTVGSILPRRPLPACVPFMPFTAGQATARTQSRSRRPAHQLAVAFICAVRSIYIEKKTVQNPSVSFLVDLYGNHILAQP